MKRLNFIILLVLGGLIIAQQPPLNLSASDNTEHKKTKIVNLKFKVGNLTSLMDSIAFINRAVDSLDKTSKKKLRILKNQQKVLVEQIKTFDTLLITRQ